MWRLGQAASFSLFRTYGEALHLSFRQEWLWIPTVVRPTGDNSMALCFHQSEPLYGVLTLVGRIERVVHRPAGMARVDDENPTVPVESGAVYRVVAGTWLSQAAKLSLVSVAGEDPYHDGSQFFGTLANLVTG